MTIERYRRVKMDSKATMLQGQAGVYRVAAQLCLRGHLPFIPAAEFGVDLVIDNGLRLQVKSAHLTFPNVGMYAKRPNFGVRGGTVRGNYLGGAYGFQLRRGAWLSAEKQYKRVASAEYSDIADFFVLWGIEEDRFWILPTSHKKRTIWFGRLDHPNNSNNASYTNKLKLDRVAQYENRWDLLDIAQSVETLVESASDPTVKEQV